MMLHLGLVVAASKYWTNEMFYHVLEILSRPTHFACLHDDMNVSSVVTMDHAIDAYSIWKCFMQFGCNLAPLILIRFAGYMYHTVLRT